MTLSTRITLGICFFAILLTGMYGAGFYAHKQLSQTIDYVTGPAWDTADGAMEATIEIEHEMLVMGQLLVLGERDHGAIDESRAASREAIQRMIAADLLDKGLTESVHTRLQNFSRATDQLWKSYTGYLDLADQLNANTRALAGVSAALEEQGDAAVESLESAPYTYTSWNSGLREKWMAADAGMEASIAFYQQRYLLQQMITGGVSPELQSQMEDAYSAYMDSVGRMRESGLFTDADLAGYEQLSQQQLQMMKNTVEALAILQQDRATYEEDSRLLLTALAEIEEQADGQVEGQLDGIALTKTTTAFIMAGILVVCLVVLGLSWLYARMRVISTLHNIAIRMKEVAEGDGNLSLRLPSNSSDELGDICRSFNRFVGKISDIVATVNKSNHELEDGITTSVGLARRIASEAEETATSCSSATREITEVRSVADNIAANCSKVATETRETETIVTDSQKQIENAIRTTMSLAESVRSSGALVRNLKKTT